MGLFTIRISHLSALGLAGLLGLPAQASDLGYLHQNWDRATREAYYFTSQGSHIMPNAWFRALATREGIRFADPAHLARFGLLRHDVPSALNPDDYAIGLAVGRDSEGTETVGFTCAACHTGEVMVSGQRIRIDGGAGHFDFDSFYQALAETVTATALDPAAFEAFASRVLGADAEPPEIDALRTAFARFQVTLQGDAALRRPALASGFGRVDALTQSINALAVRDQRTVANLVPVAAPVSYPPMWLAPDLEFVQWGPVAANPLGRNGGEVLAVFGAAELGEGTDTPFASTIEVHNLDLLEQWITELAPPAWDETLMGTIDRTRADEGAALFSQYCAGCHNMAPYRRTDPGENAFGKTFIEIGRVDYREIGTDSTYFDVLLPRQVLTNAVTAPVFDGKAQVPAPAYFLGTVAAAVQAALAPLELSEEERLRLSGYRFRKGPDGELVGYQPPSLTDFKASPLAGLWSTGPYLHNGSVPTVYELLSPEEDRRDVFWTGGRQLDRDRMGFESSEAPGRFRFDTSLPGNGNGGHLYPPGGLSPSERWAVIEYLKTQ